MAGLTHGLCIAIAYSWVDYPECLLADSKCGLHADLYSSRRRAFDRRQDKADLFVENKRLVFAGEGRIGVQTVGFEVAFDHFFCDPGCGLG